MKTLDKFIKTYLNNKGFTLTELTIVVVIAAIVIIPVYQIYFNGLQLTSKSLKQESFQGDAIQGIEEITHGFKYNNVKIYGYLSAGPADTINISNTYFTYVANSGTGNKYSVTYFLNNGFLYRNVNESTVPVDDLAIDSQSFKVAENIEAFQLEQKDDNTLQIRLKIGQSNDAIAKNSIDVTTKILPRNIASSLPPSPDPNPDPNPDPDPIPPLPSIPSDALSPNWYNNGGKIYNGEHEAQGNVIINAPSGVFDNNKQTATFKADSLFFVNSPTSVRLHGSLTLDSSMIVIYGKVEMNTRGGNNGMLSLKNSQANEIPGLGTGGLVYFVNNVQIDGTAVITPGIYFYPASGVNLCNVNNIKDNLIKVGDI